MQEDNLLNQLYKDVDPRIDHLVEIVKLRSKEIARLQFELTEMKKHNVDLQNEYYNLRTKSKGTMTEMLSEALRSSIDEIESLFGEDEFMAKKKAKKVKKTK